MSLRTISHDNAISPLTLANISRYYDANGFFFLRDFIFKKKNAKGLHFNCHFLCPSTDASRGHILSQKSLSYQNCLMYCKTGSNYIILLGPALSLYHWLAGHFS